MGQGDEFGGIRHRSAANGKNEIDTLGTNNIDSGTAVLIFRIGLNSPELHDGTVAQRTSDLIVDAVPTDGPLTI